MNKFLTLLAIILLSINSIQAKDMRFIQVDSALYNSSDKQKFENLITKINNEKDFEFVIFTGNNIYKPEQSELKAFLKDAKKLKKPFYVVLGQKDVNKKKNLGKEEYMQIVRRKNPSHLKIFSPNYVFSKKGMIFIVADGSKEFLPTPIGYYREDTILWLDDKLDDYKNKNVVIFQHYPIIPPAKRETHYTYKADEYLKLLSEHKNVKAVFAGHFNTNNEKTIDGILHVSTKDAPNYRVVDILDYETENPTFWSTIKD